MIARNSASTGWSGLLLRRVCSTRDNHAWMHRLHTLGILASGTLARSVATGVCDDEKEPTVSLQTGIRRGWRANPRGTTAAGPEPRRPRRDLRSGARNDRDDRDRSSGYRSPSVHPARPCSGCFLPVLAAGSPLHRNERVASHRSTESRGALTRAAKPEVCS